jgi:hypothetical protein
MLPFDSYPGGGRQLLGTRKGYNTRRVDVLDFMRLVPERQCAYCGLDFTATLENWLTLSFDRVVPTNLCKSTNIPEAWSTRTRYWRVAHVMGFATDTDQPSM